MEPDYREIARDLRFRYDQFIEMWTKAKNYDELNIYLILNSSSPYSTSNPLDVALYIQRMEKF